MNDPVMASIRELPSQLAKVEQLGQAGARHDLYTVLGQVYDVFAAHYPTLPCGNGCAECCQKAQFRVAEVEWEPVRQELMSWDPERRRQLLDGVRARFGPVRDALEAVAKFWKKTRYGTPTPRMEEIPLVCPLLEHDRCSVYEVRPAICRAFGAFGAVLEERQLMMICDERCDEFLDGLTRAGHTSISLAPWAPVEKRILKLNRARGVAPLPLWLLRLADELDAAPVPTPG